jgi:hypothetical protein
VRLDHLLSKEQLLAASATVGGGVVQAAFTVAGECSAGGPAH